MNKTPEQTGSHRPSRRTEACVGLLRQLIAVPSYSRDEGAAADLLQAWMAEAGLRPRRIGHNVWCSTDADGPTLLLNAHLDTVRPAAGYTRDPFAPVIEDGRLYGLGANDDGGSLIALLAAYMELSQRPQPYRLVFSATAEEEVSGPGGMDLLLPALGPVTFGLIGEPTGMRMAVAERGLMVLDGTVRGRSGHAARDEGDNAIYKALAAVEWFRGFRFERISDFLGPVKMTVTQIDAGVQHNVVPDTCRLVVDVRPNGCYTNADLLDRIRSAVPAGEWIARSLRLESTSLPLSHPVVARGLALGLPAFGSPTTSNRAVCPFPTLKLGPGDSARSHAPDEYIRLDEIAGAIDRYVQLLDQIHLT